MHDVRRKMVGEEAMDRVDVLPASRPEAEVMEPSAVLVEGPAVRPGRTPRTGIPVRPPMQ
jgi:hypothetical protein